MDESKTEIEVLGSDETIACVCPKCRGMWVRSNKYDLSQFGACITEMLILHVQACPKCFVYTRTIDAGLLTEAIDAEG